MQFFDGKIGLFLLDSMGLAAVMVVPVRIDAFQINVSLIFVRRLFEANKIRFTFCMNFVHTEFSAPQNDTKVVYVHVSKTDDRLACLKSLFKLFNR